MTLQPAELAEQNYVLIDKLHHNELVGFIQLYMKKRTTYVVFYYLANLLVFALAGYFFVEGYALPDYNVGERFTHFSIGLALAIALLPLHEYIHVLAYRSQGAKNTLYAANLKKFYFMALADQFVANKKEFEVVALAPFAVISLTLLVLLFVVSPSWTITIIGTLLAHTAMCSGDFGLLSYFEFHKDKQPVTYDDVESKTSYFYGKKA